MMSGLCRYNPCWDTTRGEQAEGRVLEDDAILLATDFEGGNGTDLRRLGPDHYAIGLEPEPGEHRFSGMGYYFCFGVRNLQDKRRSIRIRLEAVGFDGKWAEDTRHVVLRRGRRWGQLDPAAIHPVSGVTDTIDIDLTLPAASDPDSTVFASNFHWWPYTEMVEHIQALDGAEVREIGRSFQGRPIYAVEIGRTDERAPCVVHAQTAQPSEMGSLACRAMMDFLCSDAPDAAAIRRFFRICFIPMTNPDGTVLGYGVSDSQGRFPFFEGHLAAEGDPAATVETVALWQYLRRQRPVLFWEWHSNNWARRLGHMLLRYDPLLLSDPQRREIWMGLDRRLLDLPYTYNASVTSRDEGGYQNSMGFQATVHLGAISCMIKQHDKFPLVESSLHAVGCLKAAAAALGGLCGSVESEQDSQPATYEEVLARRGDRRGRPG